MIVRTQDRLSMIQCKNIVMENFNDRHSRVKIREISRPDMPIELGWYTDRMRALHIMDLLQVQLEKENRLIVNNTGNVEPLRQETIWTMPQDEPVIEHEKGS